MTEENEEQDADSAMKIALTLMQKMCEDKVDGNIAQAAVGCAWLSILKYCGNTPEQFSEITDALNEYYKESWEKERPYREAWEKGQKEDSKNG